MADRKAHTERRDALLRTMLRTKPAPRKAGRIAEEIGETIDRHEPDELLRLAEKIGTKSLKRKS